RLGLDADVHADERRAPAELDIGHLADLDSAGEHRGALVEAGDGRLEVQHVVELGPEQAGATPDQQCHQQQDDGADDECADDRRIRAQAHAADPAALCSPRVRNARTFWSGLSSRSFLGFPSAIMVRVSASRNTARSAIAKMLASSWVTTTIVAPRLVRRSRMRSSRRRDVMGSRPAEGSSKKRMSGSSAIARAPPASFNMPPLIWDG